MHQASIDVTGLPERLVREIERLVETLGEQLANTSHHNGGPCSTPAPLPTWEGTVVGTLSRREVCADDY
jgi:hypothetical protein